MELESMTFFPEVPVKGQNLTVTAKGNLKDVVDSGSKVSVSVKWGLIVRFEINLIFNLFSVSQFLLLTFVKSWTNFLIADSSVLCKRELSPSLNHFLCQPTFQTESLMST
jgi:hypothetical protein